MRTTPLAVGLLVGRLVGWVREKIHQFKLPTIDNMDYCKDHGIVLLTLQPHNSHRLQPLDRSVYGPLKKYINSACDSWMKANPGKTMLIYDIPEIVKIALPRATTPENIIAGFKMSGIYPFDMHVITDSDFLPSVVTDRPDPAISDAH